MAKTVGIDFKFTGDPTKAVAAFRQIAQAAKNAGGSLGVAGRQMEQALTKAEKAAQQQAKSVRGALSGGANQKAAGFLEGLADALGVGEFADQLGGVEGLLDGVSSKAALAATVYRMSSVPMLEGKEHGITRLTVRAGL